MKTKQNRVHKGSEFYNRSIKSWLEDVKSSTYIEIGIENNDKDSTFKVVENVRISNIKTFLHNVTLQIDLKKFFWLKKVSVPWTYAIADLNIEKIVGTFYKKELQKRNQ